VTGAATRVTATKARLAGTTVPGFKPDSVHFEYGKTTRYGKSTKAVAAGSGNAAVPVSGQLRKLTPGTTYHYRLVGVGPDRTTPGADRTFKTKPALILKSQKVKVKGGVATLKGSCPRSAPATCKGSVALAFPFSNSALAATAKKHKPKTVAKGKFKVKPGKKGKFKVRLTKTGRKLFSKHAKLVTLGTATTKFAAAKRKTAAKVTLKR
jgi:hypothetical protein